ncbi:hypothetical protein [Microbacterium invictum]|uniref:Uncharacterized protein n=1 Tax=Microbacterium invictum TaxID=515415 RepID=A0AA40VNA7_9MICO|nr:MULTISPECIES: hypothetical protein [Microbacterium]MBB4140629.1 hypothetical protein [Microbacterium invictum]
MSGLPPGWLPIPFALPPQTALEIAPELLAASGAEPGEEADLAAAVDNAAAAMSRLPVTTAVAARLWHAFGVTATGLVADLSLERRSPSTQDEAVGADFPRVDVQRRVVLDDGGLVTLAAVAPAAGDDVAFLLRVQVPAVDAVCVVDVLDRDLRAIGVVWDDAIEIARGGMRG